MIRRATPADIPALVQLVYDLAEYEKARDECTLTAEQLETALFGPRAALYAHVAESDQGVVGCAIWFLNYSTWKGVHGIFLEDLFVQPEARGRGLGRDLLAALAREAVEQGYARVDWSVLTWNTPSIDFYESIGAEHQHEWTGYRLSGGALARLASHADD
ncbi:GNAT family N-acetyltransferase [Nocardia sp. NPDC088792]|uniref:GNAT family N-acetyltransferase n=1 Tax=Nocardia sp. NPDC088792 TaxID=3364332 RepID=UPI0037FBB756